MLWGQKTLKAEESAFQRINVRRLLLALRREVKAVGTRILFEPSVAATIAKFEGEVKPILKRFKDAGGLTDYLVKIDASTTTPGDIENGIIRGKIFVAPSRTVEFLEIDFVTTSSGNFASS
jgi:phage tail sheath protein FI